MTRRRSSRRRVEARPRRVVASLTLAALAYSVMQMMVVPALPAIQRDLDASADAVAWLISAFLLSTAISTPLLGRLGDRFGKGRMLIAALVIFTLGSLLGALAPSLEALIVARVLQGCGGAVFPLAYGLARDTLPPERVAVAIGTVSGSFGIGGSAGLVLSGPLVDHVSWHAIFWVGIAMSVVAIPLVAATLPLGGRRPPSPILDLRLLVLPAVWPANAIGVLAGFGMYATGYLVPQLVQADPAHGDVGFGAGVTATSLFLLPALLSGLAAGIWAGALTRRFGPRMPLMLGAIGMVAGYALLAFAHDIRWPVYVGTLLAHGIGLNLLLAAMANAVVAAVPATRTGEAAGVNTMLRTVGGALGGQVVAAVALVGAGAAGLPTSRGFMLAFGLCAALLALAVVLAALIPAQRRL
ncbi:MFS transporter [Conexibacter arvalis]|uniref:MFS family permease n=1 Tax=Conexibacter arvalis TaxID=912552 RepID=A0A840IB35_9ACTN|nr:MFS transporter [Conexibacter arvalis]MBB4661842.1 MFS family permease [Conexibacter arvalis]